MTRAAALATVRSSAGELLLVRRIDGNCELAQGAHHPAPPGHLRALPTHGRRSRPPRPKARRSRYTWTASTRMGHSHGEPTAQDPGGLRPMPRPHPHQGTSRITNAVVTGEPDDRETI